MAFPVVELITQNVEASLRGVRKSAGYNVDLIVERELQYGNARRNNLAVLMQVETERQDQLTTPENRIAWMQRYWVECHVVEPEGSAVPVDQRINVIRADVEKAIMVDFRRGTTTGAIAGAVVDTYIRDPIQVLDEQGRWEGVIVVFDVHYRTKYEDPYTVP